MVGEELVIFLIVLSVFFVYSFVFDSYFLVLIAKNVVLILKLMEFGLQLGLLFKRKTALGLAVLALAGVINVVALTLEVGIVLRKGLVLFEQLMVPVLPDSFHLVRLLRVSVLEFVLLSQLLVLVNCVDQFLLNLLYFLEKQVMFLLEFQPFVFRVDVFEILRQNAELPGYEVVPFVKPFELLVNHDKSLFPNRV